MAWPAKMDVQHRDKLKKACMGFATGVSAHSLSGILRSEALYSNKTLEEKYPKVFGNAMRKSQWHDQPESPGYSCVYFRGVRRMQCSRIKEYLPRIVNSLTSVGSTQGLVFYVDFDTAYEKLVYGFSNSTDMKGKIGTKVLNSQVDLFVDAFEKTTNVKTGKNYGMSEITFKNQVPLSCVSFIGVDTKKTKECPDYQKLLETNFTRLTDTVIDCRGNEWLFFQNKSFAESALLGRSSYMAIGSPPSGPSERSQPSALSGLTARGTAATGPKIVQPVAQGNTGKRAQPSAPSYHPTGRNIRNKLSQPAPKKSIGKGGSALPPLKPKK